MSRRTLPQSVRASAAASVVACTAGLVSTTQTNSAQAAPVWIDAPHLEGTFQPTAEQDDFGAALGDFDQDGKNDFYFFYYTYAIGGAAFEVYAGANFLNPDADILFSSAAEYLNTGYWNITASIFSSRDEVFTAASSYTPLPRPLNLIGASDIGDEFGSRSYFGGIFKGGNGNTYVAYLDLQVIDNDDFNLASIIIYDAGYALVPEPSSLALLAVGGLLLARRRRGY